ncbi:hypothetical protein A2372_01630 [Candidatus Wolfebacteria bacterium RIFOXYB1_FULL_54_12]|uniref:Uncharacterized protein n=1 Tax=Candidatus Wolfebacteria bacterium RIFOXYB1_FULL_54_12 TaxID=1802559 RepID=A0A1F8DYR8_9BACT|nr:MAG: hypothetical protein A2372_01630 [Candidatus Wolfebacteria bacterium RIFOXYB1_FULL_54_12]
MDLINNQQGNAGMIGIPGLVKTGLLALAGIFFALGFSWFLRSFLLVGEWRSLIVSTGLAIGFLVVFTLQTFFMRSNMHFAIAFFLQSLALTAFFFSFTAPVMTLFVIVYLLLLTASYGGRKILDNTLKIDFWNISKLVAPKGIIAVTLLVSVFIPLHLQEHRDELPLSLATFDKVLASSNVFIRRFYQDFDSSQSVEQMARAATERQLASIPQAKNLSPRERELLIGKAMQDFYDQLFGYTGVKIDPKSPLSDAAYGVLQEKFTGMGDNAKLWIYVIFGSIVFVSIASIMMPIRILVALLAWVVYETLIALGFARVSIESRSKEVLLLD